MIGKDAWDILHRALLLVHNIGVNRRKDLTGGFLLLASERFFGVRVNIDWLATELRYNDLLEGYGELEKELCKRRRQDVMVMTPCHDHISWSSQVVTGSFTFQHYNTCYMHPYSDSRGQLQIL